MKKAIRTIGYILSFVFAVSIAGYVGLTKSMALVMAPVRDALASAVVSRPAPSHDASKPTVAILLGNTLSEPTDVLGPYAIFAESGAYNVYAVASSRTVRTLTGGLDVVPQLSFEELAARLPGNPDIVVVPQIVDIRSPQNSPVVDWVRRQAHGQTLLFSWCTGSEVLAESGVIDGKTVTAHWGDIGRLERTYPAVHWQRGMRYIESGSLLTTGGLTSGIDGTLHLLTRRNGEAVAAKVAHSLHIPPSPFVANPQFQQYQIGPADSIFLLNVAFHWPKRRTGVWIYDGIGELDLGSVADVYAASGTEHTFTVASTDSVVSRHGLQFIPRWQAQNAPAMDRLLVPGGDDEAANRVPVGAGGIGVPIQQLRKEGSPDFAYGAVLEDLARQHDAWTATFAAKRLEVRTPLRFVGQKWPIRSLLAPLLVGCVAFGCVAFGCVFLLGSPVRRDHRSGLELKIPPVALVAITAALMWFASSAVPYLDVIIPARFVWSVTLVLIGAAICISGVVSFRLAGTTVNPTTPGATSSLVISGIYRFTRNPMYLGFLLALLAWAVFLSNPLALAFIPAFVVYMNRFQIGPEERTLESLFAHEYLVYNARVRRWV